MFQRITRYKDNQGVPALLINTAVLLYIVYRITQLAAPQIKIILLAVLAFLFFIPLAFSSILVSHLYTTLRVMRVVQFVIYGLLAIIIFNLVALPGVALLAMILLVVFTLGVSFWLFSDPAIMSNQAYAKIETRMVNAEEKQLRKEIEKTEKQINNPFSDESSRRG